MSPRSEADDCHSQQGREKAEEEHVMDGLLHRLAASHPGGQSWQVGRGLEQPRRLMEHGSRAAVLDVAERRRGSRGCSPVTKQREAAAEPARSFINED